MKSKLEKEDSLVKKIVVYLLVIVLVIFAGKSLVSSLNCGGDNESSTEAAKSKEKKGKAETETEEVKKLFSATETDDTVGLGPEIDSGFAVVIDEQEGVIIAEKNAHKKMTPASMTKVLTILVASEQITESDLDDVVTITFEATDYAYVNDCSVTGFKRDERVTVRDLFYGTILPSGGESAYQLALYSAGSMDNFIELMNKKVDELGLSETSHFTNPVGIYDENLYTTPYDMAIIMQAAMENDICREVLTKHTYKTTMTEQSPEGITISNLFLRRIEDQELGGATVLGAKTGFVNQSGNCAVSYAEGPSKKTYICVTGSASSGWQCIYDHAYLYATYRK